MKLKHILFIGLLTSFSACKQTPKFTISGTIQHAEKSVLYLEQTALTQTITLDSVKLNAGGEFKFKAPKPEYPELYRIRMGTQQFVFPIDSCEHISLVAQKDRFAFPTLIEGSSNALLIQELRHSLIEVQKAYNAVVKQEVDVTEFQLKVSEHKEMAQKMILENPRSIVAYYALFQKVGNLFLFSPYEKSDRPYYATVATSFNAFMPEYNRSKSLYNLVLDAIKTERIEKQDAYIQEFIKNSESSMIDIELPNHLGNVRKLSELKGKVILLDFSTYETETSVQYTFALRDLYNRYSKQNFEIYQVSGDRNQILWENAVENLPWICVRGNGVYERCFGNYNVQTLPTQFLLDKSGLVVARNVPFNKLPDEIDKLLKK